MTIKEYVSHSLDSLSEAELEEIANYLAFLRFRSRLHGVPPLEVESIAALYREFGDEDRRIAEEGLAEYNASLIAEDAR